MFFLRFSWRSYSLVDSVPSGIIPTAQQRGAAWGVGIRTQKVGLWPGWKAAHAIGCCSSTSSSVATGILVAYPEKRDWTRRDGTRRGCADPKGDGLAAAEHPEVPAIHRTQLTHPPTQVKLNKTNQNHHNSLTHSLPRSSASISLAFFRNSYRPCLLASSRTRSPTQHPFSTILGGPALCRLATWTTAGSLARWPGARRPDKSTGPT